MQRYQMYIDGKYIESASGKYFDSYNPFTGEVWAHIAQGNAEDVERAVRTAHQAMTEGAWAQLTASQRGLCCTSWETWWRATRNNWPRPRCATMVS
jgi:aldehyde dehydrogenase (NAD+)